ncbi:MAG: hypothetical protein IPF79_05655 [Ignavibacteria bacterium]|nr:hypothetical protein [Ignavibacteria bacterium]
MSIAVLSLESDDLQQLNIDLASLGILRSMVPNADSIARVVCHGRELRTEPSVSGRMVNDRK